MTNQINSINEKLEDTADYTDCVLSEANNLLDIQADEIRTLMNCKSNGLLRLQFEHNKNGLMTLNTVIKDMLLNQHNKLSKAVSATLNANSKALQRQRLNKLNAK